MLVSGKETGKGGLVGGKFQETEEQGQGWVVGGGAAQAPPWWAGILVPSMLATWGQQRPVPVAC